MNCPPPEKYYEACITYHLVNEFRERFDQTLYPVSISQIEEHFKGYDFGYYFSGRSFFIQYKRPVAWQNDIYSWHIDREQLQIINNRSEMFKTYYALPAFLDMMKWYHGINHTYFIVAPRLAIHLHDFKGEKINVIHSTSNALRRWEEISDQFTILQGIISTISKPRVITFADIIDFANSLKDEERACMWVYLLKEDIMADKGVLGSYTYQNGGIIRLNMGHNMELGTEASTYFHEMQHIYLNCVTDLGFVLSALEVKVSDIDARMGMSEQELLESLRNY